eukprot:1870952-Lingulodinium_polyedra.AAC.1
MARPSPPQGARFSVRCLQGPDWPSTRQERGPRSPPRGQSGYASAYRRSPLAERPELALGTR